MRYYLGIDGGGTKTAAVILDENKTEMGRGHGGPCNIATCDDATLQQSVQDAVKAALSSARLPADTRFGSVCAGVAGYTAKKRRGDFQRLLEEIVPAERRRLEPDFVIAYWGATEGDPGVIVSAGTGSVVYGRNVAGETCRVDGRGFLLGDRGSGFEIGRRALVYTLHRLEEDLAPDPLSTAVMCSLGGEETDDLIEWVYRDFQPSRIAGLAGVVGEVAGREGGEAARIVLEGGVNLRSLVTQCLGKLGLLAESATVYKLGGIWALGDPLTAGFNGAGDEEFSVSAIELREPKHDATYGAALLAMQAPPMAPQP
jgi:N-acetylglucosamine kinase-like BadF-type ATPase